VSSQMPEKHHIDRRAQTLIQQGEMGGDDLLSTPAVADWLGVSIQFLEIGRSKGYGPTFVRVGTRRIRYRRSDVNTWLKERSFCSTAEYPSGR